MKKRKIVYLFPLAALLLSGCTFAEFKHSVGESWIGQHVLHPIYDPIKDLFGGNKENQGGDHGGDQVVAKEIKELIGVPREIAQGAKLEASSLSAKVLYSDGSEKTEAVTKVELDTSKVGETTGKAYVNSLVKEFTITVEAKEDPPVNDTISPQEAIVLMDEAGEGKVVEGLKKVKGICAIGSKYESQYKQYTTGFDGVENFKLQFTDNDNILNGASPDGMEIVVEGYLEKYQGKYQLSYLPASASPTGQKFTPNLVSAAEVMHEGALDSITVSSAHREFYKGSSFVEETVTAHYSDGATATVKAIFSGYDMNTLGEQTVTVSYTEKGVTKETTYVITVKEKEVPPVNDTISPQEAIALMDEAGEGKVVEGLKKVKGICAIGSKYESQYKQYTTGFDGVENFKLQFTDNDNILNGASPDGMEIVVEGYLEKYSGKYQLSYLPASVSPTGQKFTPNLVSAAAAMHEGALDSITVSSAHREFYKGSTFIEETVTAHYSDGTTATVTAQFSGYDMNTLGEQTVQVSYTEGGVTKTTTYTINVNEKEVPPVVEGTVIDFQNVTSVSGTVGAVSFASDKDAGQSDPAYNDNNKELRLYAKNKLTITGLNITKIVLDYNGCYAPDPSPCKKANGEIASVSSGTLTGFVWEGEAVNSVTFTVGDVGQVHVHKITVVADDEPVPGKVLSGIEVVSEEHREFTVGDAFVGETIKASYDDSTSGNVTAEFSGYDMSSAGTQTVNVSYTEGSVTKTTTYTINVKEKEVPPVNETISPQEAISLMDQAGNGVVVEGLKKVKGICAAGSKYDSQYKQYTTGFDGVENFKVQFTDTNNILNGGSPDGMEIVVEGYLEKYSGKYQLSYLPASVSPTGQKFTPNLVSAAEAMHEGALDSITVSSEHREFYKGSTFVEETVTAHYSDGTTATVTAQFSGYDMNTLGEQTVQVSYTEGEITKEATYSIEVKALPELASIEVTNAPDKVEYVVGETFDPTGMVVQANYTAGKASAVITGYTFSTDALTASDESIELSYTEDGVTKTTTVSITVSEPARAELPYTGVIADGALPEGWELTGTGATFANSYYALKADGAAVSAVKLFDERSSVRVIVSCVANGTTKESTVTVYGLDDSGAKIEGAVATFTPAKASASNASGVEANKADHAVMISGEGITGVMVELTAKGHNLVLTSISVTEPPVLVSSVALDKTEMSLEYPGANGELHATVSPDNAENKEVEWSVEGSSVTVEDGLVKPIAVGESTVTATAKDGSGKSASCVVTVAPSAKELESISITTQPDKTAYESGEVFDPTGMVVTANYVGGESEPITNYTFSTDPIAVGTTSIAISYGGKSTSVAITVTAAKGSTVDNPYTIDEVLAASASLADKEWLAEKVYVVGEIKGYAGSASNKYTLKDADGTEFLVYKSALPEGDRACIGDTAVFYGWVENFAGTIEMTSYNDSIHTDLPTTAAILTRGTSTISLDSSSSENATVTFEATATNASNYTFTVEAAEGHQIVSVKFDGETITGTEGSYTVKVMGNAKILVTTAEGTDPIATPHEYTISKFAAGEQYAEDEVHELDSTNGIVLTCSHCHFTSELRMYSSSSHNGFAIISSDVELKSIMLNLGNKQDTLNVYASADGKDYTLVEGIATTTAYADSNDIALPSGTKYIKLDVKGDQQVRIKVITLTF